MSQEPKLDNIDLAHLGHYVMKYEAIGASGNKELVERALQELDRMDLTETQELLLEELCTRVHPAWRDEITVTPSPNPTLDGLDRNRLR